MVPETLHSRTPPLKHTKVTLHGSRQIRLASDGKRREVRVLESTVTIIVEPFQAKVTRSLQCELTTPIIEGSSTW